MNNTDNLKKAKFTTTDARNFIRELWVCFNSFTMYGPDHPAARKEAEKLYELLKKMLAVVPQLTIHTQSNSLLFEEWPVDRNIDVKRLVERMNNAGIHSITFFDFLRQEDLGEFIKIMIDSRTFNDLEDIGPYLEEKQISGFVFDYYKFKKISGGGLGGPGEESTPPAAGPGSGPGPGTGSPAEKLLYEFWQSQPGFILSFSEKLRAIRSLFDAGGGPSLEKLKDALSRLKALLDENIVNGLGEEPSPEEWEAILEELDALTISIISRAVRDALESEGQPISGMADYFRKLDPSLEFTMKALPRIKTNLFDTGITLRQYLQFLQSLAEELTLMEFKALLEKSGGDIGVTKREIADEMKKNHHDVIPLVNLAVKLEPLLPDPAESMMYFLYQYAEKELRNLVMINLSDKIIEKSDDIVTYLDDSKQQYLRLLAEGGMTLKIVQDLNNLFKQRISVLGHLLWAEVLIFSTGGRDGLPDGEALRRLAEKINGLSEGKTLLNSILYVLEEKGLSKELLNRFIRMVTGSQPLAITGTTADTETEAEEVVEQEGRRKSYRLPQGIPNLRETQRYLEMEINRTLRYHTPFSCISISITRGSSGQQKGEPTPAELEAAFTEITRLLRNSLRNLDFIGSLGTLRENHIFVIMTMTDMEGCLKVAVRLGERIKEFPVEVEGKRISAAVTISAITFDPEETPDIQSFVRKVKSYHQEEIKRVAG